MFQEKIRRTMERLVPETIGRPRAWVGAVSRTAGGVNDALDGSDGGGIGGDETGERATLCSRDVVGGPWVPEPTGRDPQRRTGFNDHVSGLST